MRYAARGGWISLLVALLACQSAGSAPPPAAPAATSVSSAAPAAPAATAAPAAAAEPAQTGMPAPLAPPVTVRIGVLSSVSDSGIYIGLGRGYYRDLGLELQGETIPDPNASRKLTWTNQLEVGGFGVNANPFQAAARGIGIKMVADKGSLRPGFGYAALIGRQDLLDS